MAMAEAGCELYADAKRQRVSGSWPKPNTAFMPESTPSTDTVAPKPMYAHQEDPAGTGKLLKGTIHGVAVQEPYVKDASCVPVPRSPVE